MRSLSEIIKANREAVELYKNGSEEVRQVLTTDVVRTAVGVIMPVDQDAVRHGAGIQPWSKGAV